MNYRHGYHAGNFADVFKHAILIALIKTFLRKENPFCYIETHSGSGYYDLFSEYSKKNNEFEEGVEKVLHQQDSPLIVKEYISCVQRLNNRLSHSAISSLRYYPGSPLIASYFLREHDRLILSELHPEDYQQLKKTLQNDMRAGVHLQDGYQGLKAFLPPKERRGLILIDPPYERPNEWMSLAAAIPTALKRFNTGVYALWYPIKDHENITRFQQIIKTEIKQPILTTELTLYNEALPTHLNGCGMMIINPPWQFEKELHLIVPWLWRVLSIEHQGQFTIR